MRQLKVWINGRFIDIDDAKISVFDRGFLYGDGIFETMRSYAGIVFSLDEHLDRFFKLLKIVRIKCPYTKGELKDAIYRSLKTNMLKSAYIRMTITRGEGRFGLDYSDRFSPNVVIVTKEFGEYPKWMYERGISAKVVETRQNERSALSRIKSLNFLNNILARLDAKDENFDEAILMNTKGHIAEASTANIFLRRRGRLITPSLDSGILAGITRGVVIKIAKKLKIKVNEGLVSYQELLKADEVFLTNSLVELLPLKKVDSKIIGDGSPGELTKLLHISYQRQVIEETAIRYPH